MRDGKRGEKKKKKRTASCINEEVTTLPSPCAQSSSRRRLMKVSDGDVRVRQFSRLSIRRAARARARARVIAPISSRRHYRSSASAPEDLRLSSVDRRENRRFRRGTGRSLAIAVRYHRGGACLSLNKRILPYWARSGRVHRESLRSSRTSPGHPRSSSPAPRLPRSRNTTRNTEDEMETLFQLTPALRTRETRTSKRGCVIARALTTARRGTSDAICRDARA